MRLNRLLSESKKEEYKVIFKKGDRISYEIFTHATSPNKAINNAVYRISKRAFGNTHGFNLNAIRNMYKINVEKAIQDVPEEPYEDPPLEEPYEDPPEDYPEYEQGTLF